MKSLRAGLQTAALPVTSDPDSEFMTARHPAKRLCRGQTGRAQLSSEAGALRASGSTIARWQ